MFHPQTTGEFYIGLERFFGQTADGGLNWNYSYIPGTSAGDNNYVSKIALDVQSGTFYLSVNGFGDYGEVYKSTDGGSTFFSVLSTEDLLNNSRITQEYPFNVVVIDPSNYQRILAGGGSFNAPKIDGDLWESTDEGGTWNKTSLQSVIVNDVIINPQASNIMYAGAGYSGGTDVPLYKSVDGGVTWNQSFSGMPGTGNPWNSVTDLEFHKVNRDIVYAATLQQGIYVSQEATAWLNFGATDYSVYSIAVSSLYAGTEKGMLKLTGAGVIAGKIIDAGSQQDINNARICNDFGIKTASANGKYIMVSPIGICSVAAVASGYETVNASNTTVLGGDVTAIDFTLQGGISNPSVICGQDTTVNTYSGKSASVGCFIATAAYGSPMSKQVEILRLFRDRYLLPNSLGKKMVNIYYRNGKPAADYINSHTWLKPPIRFLLYPLIGLSWFMLSTSSSVKMFAGLFFITGMTLLIRKIKARKTV